MNTSTTLDTLAAGQAGTIQTILARGDLARRIRDLGLIPGKAVTVVGRAPLEDPMAVRLGGSTLSLRRSEAAAVRVAVADTTAGGE